MPNFPIIDTHVHLWDLGLLHYPWLTQAPKINSNHLLPDYNKACEDITVSKIVFLQCECDQAKFQDESNWVSSLAKKDNRISAIVPWAPLELGDKAKPALESITQDSLVKGVRRIIQFESDSTFCIQPNFIEGVKLLEQYNLSFDICINHLQLTNTIKLVRQCPNVRFVLDHIAKPSIKTGLLDPWRSDIKTLSQEKNVWCKLSGLTTEADWDKWTDSDLKPYIDHIIDCFGFSRLMYGGDWPVSAQATTYKRWVDTVDTLTRSASESELKSLYVTTAESFYRI